MANRLKTSKIPVGSFVAEVFYKMKNEDESPARCKILAYEDEPDELEIMWDFNNDDGGHRSVSRDEILVTKINLSKLENKGRTFVPLNK